MMSPACNAHCLPPDATRDLPETIQPICSSA